MKRERHEVVVDLIHKYDIETQEELAAYLRGEGFDVTQATVSGKNIIYFKMMIPNWGINIFGYSETALFLWIWRKIYW